jgi:hypothetical protein
MFPRSDEKDVPSGPRMLIPRERDSIFSCVEGLIEYEGDASGDSIASLLLLEGEMSPPRIEGA